MSFWDRTAVQIVILLAFAAVILLPFLGETRYVDGREARHAKIAQTMVETGIYSVPYVNGKPYIDKPPLFNWTQALFYKLAGGASHATFLLARLPSVLCAVLAMLCVYVLGRRWFSVRAGFLSALIWITSFLVVQWAHFARPDMMLAAFVLLAVLLADVAATAGRGWPRFGWWCAASVVLGAATLSKGPQSLFFWIVPVAALWPVRGGQARAADLAAGRRARHRRADGGRVAASRPSTCTPANCGSCSATSSARACTSTPSASRSPLTRCSPRRCPGASSSSAPATGSSAKSRREGYSVAVVPALTVAICLVALTILPNKRGHYLLPVAPFWALLLGMFLDRAVACRTEGETEPCGLGIPKWTFDWTLGVGLAMMTLVGVAAVASPSTWPGTCTAPRRPSPRSRRPWPSSAEWPSSPFATAARAGRSSSSAPSSCSCSPPCSRSPRSTSLPACPSGRCPSSSRTRRSTWTTASERAAARPLAWPPPMTYHGGARSSPIPPKEQQMRTFRIAVVGLAVIVVAGALSWAAEPAAPKSDAKAQPAAVKQPAAAKETAPNLATKENRYSYSFGVNLGRGLSKQGFALETDAFLRGVKDGLTNAKPLMSEVDMQQSMQRLQEVLAAHQRRVQAGSADALRKGQAFLTANGKRDGVVTLPDGLQYRVIKAGSDPKPTAADTVTVNYTGKLVDGTVFDSSDRHGGPAKFRLGNVIKGWQEGLELMKKGAKWELFIPSELAYGAAGRGPAIGPNEVLVFTVELVDIQKQ